MSMATEKVPLLLERPAVNAVSSSDAEAASSIEYGEDKAGLKNEAADVPVLRKHLNLLDAICLVVNMIVGSGIFTSPGVALMDSGSIVLAFAAWTAAAGMAACGGLLYAELGSSLPSAGGDAHYYQVAFGESVAFMYVWSSFSVVGSGGTALVALTFARYAGSAIFSLNSQAENIDSDIRIQALAVGCITVSTIFNCLGVHARSTLQYTFVLCKFILVVLLGAAALIFLSRDTSIFERNFSQASKGGNFSGFGLAVVAAFWAFLGWGGIVNVTEELNEPQKDVPRAIFGGIGIVTAIYLCLNGAYLSVLTISDVKTSAVIGMDTAAVSLGSQAGQIISILVAISTLGTLNASLLAHGRFLYAAARSGYIFNWMSHISRKNRAPYVALIIHGSWCIAVLAILQTFHQILGYFGPVSIFFMGLTAAAYIKIRWDFPELPRPYKVKFHPIIPVVVIIACLYLIIMSFITNLFPTSLAFGLAILSVPCYGLSRCIYGSNFLSGKTSYTA